MTKKQHRSKVDFIRYESGFLIYLNGKFWMSFFQGSEYGTLFEGIQGGEYGTLLEEVLNKLGYSVDIHIHDTKPEDLPGYVGTIGYAPPKLLSTIIKHLKKKDADA